MKNFYTSLRVAALLLALPFAAWAQGVGVGTTAPDASAALDIVSSSKGLLLPRVAALTAVANPAAGLMVFQTGGTAGFYYNAGTPSSPNWRQLITSAQLAAVNAELSNLNAQTANLSNSVAVLDSRVSSLEGSAGAGTTASNGLTKTGQNVALGGPLTAATTIAQGGNHFNLTGGNVGIGTTAPGARLEVSGHTKLGNTGAVPAVAMLKLTGTMPTATSGPVTVPLGVPSAKVLSVSLYATAFGTLSIPPNYSQTATNVSTYEYSYYLNGTNLVIVTGNNASAVLGAPFRALVTYEQ